MGSEDMHSLRENILIGFCVFHTDYVSIILGLVKTSVHSNMVFHHKEVLLYYSMYNHMMCVRARVHTHTRIKYFSFTNIQIQVPFLSSPD